MTVEDQTSPGREVKSAELCCVEFGRYKAIGDDILGRFLLVPLQWVPSLSEEPSFGLEEDQL